MKAREEGKNIMIHETGRTAPEIAIRSGAQEGEDQGDDQKGR